MATSWRWWIVAPALFGCAGGGGTPVPFGEACTKANEDKVLAVEGILDEETSLACEVNQYAHGLGHCRFGLISFDGKAAGRYTLDIEKGTGENQVSLGAQPGPGLHRYDPEKVVFIDKTGKPFHYRDRIRVVAKFHLDPLINPDFPPSCSLEMKSLELIAVGTPEDDKAREAGRGSIRGPKREKACAKGEEITVAGVKEIVHVTGECASVTVSGGDNEVTIDAAGYIKVSGIKNVVRWRQGLGGKPPKVSDSGIDSKVERIP